MRPEPWSGAQESGDTASARPGVLVRTLDALAGLLAAGVLVAGALLLLAQLVAPAALSAAGWGAATGPGWWPVAAHLLVGGVGEVVVRRRSRWARGPRVLADVVVVAAALVTVAWAWWP